MASWDKNSGKGNFLSKIWPLALLGGIYGYAYVQEHFNTDDAKKEKPTSYTEFVKLANNKTITSITIDGTKAFGVSKNNAGKLQSTYTTSLPENLDVEKTFKDSDADISFGHSSSFSWGLLFLLIGGTTAWKVFKDTSLKKRLFREKEIKEEISSVTFQNIAGIDEIATEVQEVVSFLKGNKDTGKFGIKVPKGLLLVGPPGNGKTLLAKAIAGEAGVPFYSAAATEFENMFYGNSAKQVRDLFAKARKKAPCIIFIDEIDAVGKKRGGGVNSAHESIVVELLNQMDGFEPLENVLVIAATNTPEVLDAALLRPGRFDRQIVIPMPDVKAREQILRVHSKKRPLDQNVDLQIIAQHTYGFSGADIANLVNEASINAARKTDATTITAEDFDAAIDRITMGTKRDLHITEEQRWTTCVHEAGHTITALEKEKDGAAPLHKVTITPHGEALGITMMRPSQETYGYTLKELKSQLVVLFGGRVAEEIMLGGPEEVGTGASSDIQRATDIAWRMVTRFGFSELGPIRFGNSQEGYLGSSPESKLDATTSAKVYEQVSSIIRGAEEEARQILTAKRDDLERLARELMTKETMMAHEVRAVIGQAPTPS